MAVPGKLTGGQQWERAALSVPEHRALPTPASAFVTWPKGSLWPQSLFDLCSGQVEVLENELSWEQHAVND